MTSEAAQVCLQLGVDPAEVLGTPLEAPSRCILSPFRRSRHFEEHS